MDDVITIPLSRDLIMMAFRLFIREKFPEYSTPKYTLDLYLNTDGIDRLEIKKT